MEELRTSNVHLIKGDCLEVMKNIKDKSIDMILCDLPYGTTECSWDNIIDFEKLWDSYERIIKDNGAMVLFGNEPFSTKLRNSRFNLYKYEWIWIKNVVTGHLEAKNKPLRKFENIIVFSKGNSANGCKNRITYNPQGLIEVNKTRKTSCTGSILGTRPSRQKGNIIVQKYTNYPVNILEFKKDKGRLHPTQKPVELLKYLIKTYTTDGETILDNCMGSGSTGQAVLEVGGDRKFIGIELDDNYFDIAYNRINGYIYE